MITKVNTRRDVTVTLSPGEYWIGDPCYIVPDDWWMQLLQTSDYLQCPGKIDGVEVVAFRTYYGDGVYKDNLGNKYGVDAGLLGVVDIRQAKKAGWKVPVGETSGHTFKFKVGFKAYSHNGVITFGHVSIKTREEEEEEEEEEENS